MKLKTLKDKTIIAKKVIDEEIRKKNIKKEKNLEILIIKTIKPNLSQRRGG